MNMKLSPPLVALVLGTLVLSGCATAPQVPNEALQAANIAVTRADSEKASEYAPLELKSAHDKLTSARAAVASEPTKDDVIAARQLADEAQADAELASARARAARAAAVNDELQKNIDTLRNELQRSTGAAS